MKTRLDLLKNDFYPQILHKIIDREITIKDLCRRSLMLKIGDEAEINKKINGLKNSLENLNNVSTIILEMIKQEEKND